MVLNKMKQPGIGPRFYREKRSRGRMAWTNDQTGSGAPLGGVGKGGGPPPPLPNVPPCLAGKDDERP